MQEGAPDLKRAAPVKKSLPRRMSSGVAGREMAAVPRALPWALKSSISFRRAWASAEDPQLRHPHAIELPQQGGGRGVPPVDQGRWACDEPGGPVVGPPLAQILQVRADLLPRTDGVAAHAALAKLGFCVLGRQRLGHWKQGCREQNQSWRASWEHDTSSRERSVVGTELFRTDDSEIGPSMCPVPWVAQGAWFN